jgi:hypothetical protein
VTPKTTGIHGLCVGDIAQQFRSDVVVAAEQQEEREASTTIIVKNCENNALFDMAKVKPGLIKILPRLSNS